MAHMVLGIGYDQKEHEAVLEEWRSHDIDFHFVNSIAEASVLLEKMRYICITVSTNFSECVRLDILHSIQPIPIWVLSPDIDVSKRAENINRVVLENFFNEAQCLEIEASSKDAVQHYLDNPSQYKKPLSIYTENEISVCLEERIVKVSGHRIELPPKEFDILVLLITQPKQVLKYSTIYSLVWREDETCFSRKVLANHISNLRKKLRVCDDMPNYVININRIGYKFDPA